METRIILYIKMEMCIQMYLHQAYLATEFCEDKNMQMSRSREQHRKAKLNKIQIDTLTHQLCNLEAFLHAAPAGRSQKRMMLMEIKV